MYVFGYSYSNLIQNSTKKKLSKFLEIWRLQIPPQKNNFFNLPFQKRKRIAKIIF
jgi:hypothetical protein